MTARREACFWLKQWLRARALGVPPQAFGFITDERLRILQNLTGTDGVFVDRFWLRCRAMLEARGLLHS